MERIAVECKSSEEWFSVEEEAFKRGFAWSSGKDHKSWWREFQCINITETTLQHSQRTYYKDCGYKIITAQEYLNEGGKDVSEFQMGDRVECINVVKPAPYVVGGIYTVKYVDDTWVGLEETRDTETAWYKKDFKLINKTQTTKENNMNINKTIRKIFAGAPFEQVEKMQEHFGSEIQENFSGEIFLKANKKKFEDEIIRREEEAKRLEKEEKEG